MIGTSGHEADYLGRREARERLMASAATCGRSRHAHEALAAAYARRRLAVAGSPAC